MRGDTADGHHRVLRRHRRRRLRVDAALVRAPHGQAPGLLPQDGEAVWQVTEHAWIYVVATRHEGAGGRDGKALLTILVDDLDDRVAHIAERGLPVGPIDETSGSVRRVVISDPEGNRITFAQVRS